MKPELSLSTSWMSQRHEDGYAMLKEAAEAGFETVELGHGIRYSLWPGVLKALQDKVVRLSSLHNFCPVPIGSMNASPNCYEFTDPRPAQRRKAEALTRETITHAAELGARAVVLHLGSTPQYPAHQKLQQAFKDGKLGSRSYVKQKLDAVCAHERLFEARWPDLEEILKNLGEHASRLGVKLGLECREAIHEVPLESLWERIFENLGPETGYWHDFGHAARKDAMGFLDHLPYFEKMSSRLVGCHLHDFVLPATDHQALGAGTIPFGEFWKKLKNQPLFVLELSPRVPAEEMKACLTWWKNHGPK